MDKNHTGVRSYCPGCVGLMVVHFLAAKVDLVFKRDAAKTRSPSSPPSSPVLPSFFSRRVLETLVPVSPWCFPHCPHYNQGSQRHHSPDQRTGGSDATTDFIFCDQIIKYSSNAGVVSLSVLSLLSGPAHSQEYLKKEFGPRSDFNSVSHMWGGHFEITCF